LLLPIAAYSNCGPVVPTVESAQMAWPGRKVIGNKPNFPEVPRSHRGGAAEPSLRPGPRLPAVTAAYVDSGSRVSVTTAILPTRCAVCPPSSAESGRIAALKQLR
jgi:hypothetical protein